MVSMYRGKRDLENRDFLSTSKRESLTDELNWTSGCGIRYSEEERKRE